MDTKTRLVSLDVYRGMTIAAMILVNNPGSWSSVYAPLRHADWHGVTPTDWIFPFFLFIVGVAIAFAIGSSREMGVSRELLVRKILRRSVIIFAVGLFLSAYPHFDMNNIRIPGVLQRIALVYGAAALLFLWFKPRQLLLIGIACLLGYWGLMTLVPVPDGHAPNLEPATNLGAWLDRSLLGGHLWSQSKIWDPEGLLSTIPAVATCISGILTGVWLRTNKDQYEKVAGMMVVGVVLLVLGLVWDTVFPINKQLWTSSYVLYTSGVGLLLLGAVYWWVDIKGRKWGTRPFIVFGMNAIAVFTLSGLIARTFNIIGLQKWLWQSVFEPAFASPLSASLAHAITHVLLLLGIAWILYARKIFIKV